MKYSSRRRNNNSKMRLRLWFIFIFLFSVFTLGLVYFGKNFRIEKRTINNVESISPKFEFYTSKPTHQKINNIAKYELDIKTVINYSSADKIKSELTLLGFTVNIFPVRVRGLQKYYISVGPYYDKESAIIAMNKLSQNKITSKLKQLNN